MLINRRMVLCCLVIVTLSGLANARSRRMTDGAPQPPVVAQISVCFVPAQECGNQIVAAITEAKRSIRVQAYGFTAPPILEALAAAQARGVDVQAILDKSNDVADRTDRFDVDNGRSRTFGAAFTARANIPTWIDDGVAIAHNKVIVIDEVLVIGGSYNYTHSAEHRNAENVTFTQSADIARMFLDNWEARRAVSRPSRYAVGAVPSAPDRLAAARPDR